MKQRRLAVREEPTENIGNRCRTRKAVEETQGTQYKVPRIHDRRKDRST